jgi:hypothetical protein
MCVFAFWRRPSKTASGDARAARFETCILTLDLERSLVWGSLAGFRWHDRPGRIAVNLRLTPDAIGDSLALFLARSSDPAAGESE